MRTVWGIIERDSCNNTTWSHDADVYIMRARVYMITRQDDRWENSKIDPNIVGKTEPRTMMRFSCRIPKDNSLTTWEYKFHSAVPEKSEEWSVPVHYKCSTSLLSSLPQGCQMVLRKKVKNLLKAGSKSVKRRLFKQFYNGFPDPKIFESWPQISAVYHKTSLGLHNSIKFTLNYVRIV